MSQRQEDNENWKSPIACLIHAAFADPVMFHAAKCFNNPIELPPKLQTLMEIGNKYKIRPENLWWITAETPVSSWPTLLSIFESNI
jgi:hypothetical protein